MIRLEIDGKREGALKKLQELYSHPDIESFVQGILDTAISLYRSHVVAVDKDEEAEFFKRLNKTLEFLTTEGKGAPKIALIDTTTLMKDTGDLCKKFDKLTNDLDVNRPEAGDGMS